MRIKLSESNIEKVQRQLSKNAQWKWTIIVASAIEAFLFMMFRILISLNEGDKQGNSIPNSWVLVFFWSSTLISVAIHFTSVLLLWMNMNFFFKRHYEVRIKESKFGDVTENIKRKSDIKDP